MSKTKDFSKILLLESNDQLGSLEVIGRDITITVDKVEDYDNSSIVGKKWKISLKNNHCEIWFEKSQPLQYSFIGRVSGDNLPQKVIKFIIDECKIIIEKETNRSTNISLCDYLTNKLMESKFRIINKSGTTNCGTYTVARGHTTYAISSSIENSEVLVSSRKNDHSELIGVFSLSNPDVDELIKEAIVRKEEGASNDNQIGNRTNHKVI